MSEGVAEVIAAAAVEADATMDEPMRDGATGTKPNRSVPVAVRLTPEDAAAIEGLAEGTGCAGVFSAAHLDHGRPRGYPNRERERGD